MLDLIKSEFRSWKPGHFCIDAGVSGALTLLFSILQKMVAWWQIVLMGLFVVMAVTGVIMLWQSAGGRFRSKRGLSIPKSDVLVVAAEEVLRRGPSAWPLIELAVEAYLLSKPNPRLAMHFHGYNGGLWPIKLASRHAVGNIECLDESIPVRGQIEVKLHTRSDSEISHARPGQVFVLTISMFIEPRDAERILAFGREQHYVNFSFRNLDVFATSYGGMDDTAIHKIIFPREQVQLHGSPHWWQGSKTLWDFMY